MMRHPLPSCVVALTACLTACTPDPVKRQRRLVGSVGRSRVAIRRPEILWHAPLASPQEALDDVDAVSAELRIIAAATLGRILSSRNRHQLAPRLEQLLTDPDLVVRRVAAQSLYGGRALGSSPAETHGYAKVLAAGRRVDEFMRVVRRGGPAEQYQATRELVKLGWPAVWSLHLRSRGHHTVVALSALLAIDEISAAYTNVPPAWVPKIQRQLREKTVSVDFNDVGLADALAHVSKASGIPIRLSEHYDWTSEDIKVTVTIPEMAVEGVLGWVTKLTNTRYHLEDGGILVYPGWPGGGHSLRTVLIDVRDLEAAGMRLDWRACIASQVPELDISHWAGPGPGFRNYRGILLVDFLVDAGDWAARKQARAIRAYLDRLRAAVKLDPTRVRELDEAMEEDDIF